jgi:hypothetical protein
LLISAPKPAVLSVQKLKSFSTTLAGVAQAKQDTNNAAVAICNIRRI